ncbi:MAG TPA: glycosyltransferase family 39 protein [Patescibacteria group bacterium]|nr:glycosyltransferase family 39 protein [Patescibacteria group bacterium]
MKTISAFFKNPIVWIFLLALVLRIYKLDKYPYGFHVDEVNVAWNAQSILKTGHDDHGNFLSLYYNSFGDFRPTGIFYITIPSLILFGRSEFATRFPVALFGAMTVFPIYLLVELLDENKKRGIKNINTGYLAGFLLAISPWHIELSRATNEVIPSAFFALISLFLFIKLIKTQKYKFGILSIITIVFSYLFYHSIRFLAPLIFIITFFYFVKEVKNRRIKIWAWLCIISTLLLTSLFSINKEGLARFNQVSIFKSIDTEYEIQRIKNENFTINPLTIIFDSRYVVYSKQFINEYAKYFSGGFLIGSSGRPYRFSTPGTGLITYIEIALLIVGLIEVAKGKKNLLLLLLLLLIAPIPAAITIEDSPNLSRAFFMLPFLISLEAYGLKSVLMSSSKYKNQIIFTIFSLLILNFLYFDHMYFKHSLSHRPFLTDYFVDSPTYRDVGAKELSLQLDILKQKYDKIIITNFPDNPYPWYAFFTNKDPADFNKTFNLKTKERTYDNIIFSQEKCPTDNDLLKYNKENILMIDSWECPFLSQISDKTPLKIVGSIGRPDGSGIYTFLERDWSKPLIINGVTIN